MNKQNRILAVIWLLLLATVILSACGAARKSARVSGPEPRDVRKKDEAHQGRTDYLLEFASQYIGTPYRYGGDNPREGFDCSGFASFVFNEAGVQLPRVSADMSKAGKYVGKNELRKGDLVFFATGSSRRINHVGIVIETKPEVLMIHSSTSKGIRIDDINSQYYRRRYVTSRRVDLDQ